MPERELIRMVQNGDSQALDTIIKGYYGDIYSFLARRTGDAQLAQDLTQECFVRFTKALGAYHEREKLRSYLFKIAVNCSNDYYRRKKENLSLDELGDIPSNESSLSESVEAKELGERVRRAVLGLPDTMRDTVILRYYHDMKLRQISEILSAPVPTVKTRLRRAQAILKEVLKDERP